MRLLNAVGGTAAAVPPICLSLIIFVNFGNEEVDVAIQ